MKLRKKALAFFAAASLLLCSLPFSVSAEGEKIVIQPDSFSIQAVTKHMVNGESYDESGAVTAIEPDSVAVKLFCGEDAESYSLTLQEGVWRCQNPFPPLDQITACQVIFNKDGTKYQAEYPVAALSECYNTETKTLTLNQVVAETFTVVEEPCGELEISAEFVVEDETVSAGDILDTESFLIRITPYDPTLSWYREKQLTLSDLSEPIDLPAGTYLVTQENYYSSDGLYWIASEQSPVQQKITVSEDNAVSFRNFYSLSSSAVDIEELDIKVQLLADGFSLVIEDDLSTWYCYACEKGSPLRLSPAVSVDETATTFTFVLPAGAEDTEYTWTLVDELGNSAGDDITLPAAPAAPSLETVHQYSADEAPLSVQQLQNLALNNLILSEKEDTDGRLIKKAAAWKLLCSGSSFMEGSIKEGAFFLSPDSTEIESVPLETGKTYRLELYYTTPLTIEQYVQDETAGTVQWQQALYRLLNTKTQYVFSWEAYVPETEAPDGLQLVAADLSALNDSRIAEDGSTVLRYYYKEIPTGEKPDGESTPSSNPDDSSGGSAVLPHISSSVPKAEQTESETSRQETDTGEAAAPSVEEPSAEAVQLEEAAVVQAPPKTGGRNLICIAGAALLLGWFANRKVSHRK